MYVGNDDRLSQLNINEETSIGPYVSESGSFFKSSMWGYSRLSRFTIYPDDEISTRSTYRDCVLSVIFYRPILTCECVSVMNWTFRDFRRRTHVCCFSDDRGAHGMERNIGDQLNKAFEAYRQVSIEKDNAKKELQQMVTTRGVKARCDQHCTSDKSHSGSCTHSLFTHFIHVWIVINLSYMY